ncbi:MAG: hypothetical protein DSZ03_07815 [Sulfurimonas sp.]|nr:MAG: hypothetical protein DSZ03_07815 [Sulfurimonas sp.]
MDLMGMASDFLKGNSAEGGSDVMGALSQLIGEGDSLNLESLLESMGGASGLGDIAASWLGNGENLPISTEQISALFGSEKLSNFASSLGVDTDSAMETIAQALPNLVDSSSPDGTLVSMDSMEDVMNLAKRFFS